MAIFEPLPDPTIVNLDPNFFEAFVALRVEEFKRTAEYLGGPAMEITDLAGSDIEAATDADWFDAAAEATGLHDATLGDEILQAARNGDALDLDLDDQASQPPLDPGPGADEEQTNTDINGIKGGTMSGDLLGLEGRTRALREPEQP